jgi:uncharacterized protein (TIGR03790 family)
MMNKFEKTLKLVCNLYIIKTNMDMKLEMDKGIYMVASGGNNKFKLIGILVIIIILLIPSYTMAQFILMGPELNYEDMQQNNEIVIEQPQTTKSETQYVPELRAPPIVPKDHPMYDYSDTVLIVNDNSAISKQIGDYFKANRNIPEKNICNITVPTTEGITRTQFTDLRNQVEDFLDDNQLTDKTNYLITTKGVPIRIDQSPANRRASVDSELCLINGIYSTFIDSSANPKISQHVYFNRDEPFSRDKFHIYLVTRLTGYNFSDVKQLIDNAAASLGSRSGFFFDRDSTKPNTGAWRPPNTRMSAASDILTARGYSSTVDNTNTFHTQRSNLAGYVSWGRNDGRYYSSPLQNEGMDSPSNPAVQIPNNWVYEDTHINSLKTRNETINRSEKFAVKFQHFVNDTGYTSLSQNVTIKSGIKYYLSGYVSLASVENYDGGGAFLQIKAYNSTNDLVWMQNGTRRYGSSSGAFWSLYTVPYDPIPGVTKLRASAIFSKAEGTVYFDDVYLYEVKPKNSYVPGAIGHVYGYYSAYSVTPWVINPFTVGNFISDGITGMKGYVNYPGETYLNFITRPNILFERYTDGYTLAESYYMAFPYMSWVDVVIGDPKTAPYFDSMPDVKVEAKNITLSTEQLNQGKTVRIQAKVVNTGGGNFNNLNVSILVGDELKSATKLVTETIPTLNAGGSSIIIYDWNTIDYNGTQNIWVEADPEDLFMEQNETNNYDFKQIEINSNPYYIELKVSSNNILRGETVDIFVNISDIETPENLLNCTIYYNHSTINSWIMLPDLDYKTDHWQTKLLSDETSATGWYDINITAKDQNNAEIMLVKKKVFRISNNPPQLDGLEILKKAIYRGEEQIINFTASDFEDTVTKDMLEVQLKPPGVKAKWFTVLGEFEFNSDDSQWQFTFTSNKTYKTGEYGLNVSIKDSDNDMFILSEPKAFEALNNAPVITKVSMDKTELYRTPSSEGIITISIYGNDFETLPNEMVVELENKLIVDIKWTKMTEPQWVSDNSRWEVIFKTDTETFTGNYTFRARLKDNDGEWTDYLEAESELRILNNPPIAKHNFEGDYFQAKEDQSIFFDATNSTDLEDVTISTFLWQFDDGTTSDAKTVSKTFQKEGEYTVFLTVYDKNYDSNTTFVNIKIRNVIPKVVTELDKIQAAVNEEITFNGDKSYDTSSDMATLTYLWDFDDGTTSNLSKVVKIWTDPGTYAVTLTVIDDDNESVTSDPLIIDITPLIIDKPDDGKQDSLDLMQLLPIILIIIIIIIIILVIVAMVTKKRKKREEELKPTLGKVRSAPEKIETLEPEIVTKPVTQQTQAGRGRPLESKLDALPESGPIAILPEASSEVELEFVPELPAQKAVVDTTSTMEGVEFPEEELEEAATEIDEDIVYSMPVDLDTAIEKDVPEEEIEFVAPKIDIPDISTGEVHLPDQEEIDEAQKRGEGVSLDFKAPDKKKKII